MTLLQGEGLSWVQALGWTLLHSIWQGALIGAIFALLRSSIPRQRCDARYANGLVALALLAILPIATLFVVHSAQMASATAPSFSGVSEKLSDVVAEMDVSATPALASIDMLLPWVVCLWMTGVVLVAGWSLHQWRALVRIARDCALPDAQLDRLLLGVARQFNFVRRIRVLVSDHIDTPTLIGWINPLILLPTAVALGFPREQIALILAHELGHVRRYDHLVNMAQALLETLFFYHPVVHWISRDVRNEREICCDALVLRRVASKPRDYARTLAALEELRQPPAHLALAASGGVLLERVRRIVGIPMPAAPASWSLRLVAAAIGGIGVAAAIAVQMQSSAVLTVDGLSLRVDYSARTLSRPFGEIALSELVRLAPAMQLQKIELQPSGPVPAAQARAQPTGASVAPAKVLPAGIPGEVAKTAPSPSSDTQLPEQRISATAKVDAPAVPFPTTAAVVQSVAAAKPAEIATPHSAPVATRTTAPEYPYSTSVNRRERVELAFAIDARGGVRDIQVVSEPADAAFARAATRALEHWRFDPATSSSPSTHYRQVFVFAPPSARGDASGCIRRTGSQLCQKAGESEIEGENSESNGIALASMR